VLIEQAREEDRPFLFAMFVAAAFHEGPPPELSCAQVAGDPALGVYVRDWGRSGDAALVARDQAGAAWYRLFDAAEPGYGFVDEATPELGLAVAEGRRGEGVGRALLSALLDHARAAGFPALSLSVSRANPRARRLYDALGFVPLHDVGGSTTMRVAL
jgi:GNAT superfamily N-acetyltransferase